MRDKYQTCDDSSAELSDALAQSMSTKDSSIRRDRAGMLNRMREQWERMGQQNELDYIDETAAQMQSSAYENPGKKKIKVKSNSSLSSNDTISTSSELRSDMSSKLPLQLIGQVSKATTIDDPAEIHSRVTDNRSTDTSIYIDRNKNHDMLLDIRNKNSMSSVLRHPEDSDPLALLEAGRRQEDIQRQQSQRTKPHISRKNMDELSVLAKGWKNDQPEEDFQDNHPLDQEEYHQQRQHQQHQSNRPEESRERKQVPSEDDSIVAMKAGVKGRRQVYPEGYKKSDRSAAFFDCLGSDNARYVIIGLLVYAFIATGIGGYFLQQFFRIPGLDNQIGDLTKQVTALETEVDTLTAEIDRLSSEVDRLEGANKELDSNIENLKAENLVTKDLMRQFRGSNADLEVMNVVLAQENKEYEKTAAELQGTVISLRAEVDSLSFTKHELNETLGEYKEITSNLSAEVFDLTNVTGNLNETVHTLYDSIERFEAENERFRQLNQELTLVVSYLQDETEDVQVSHEELVSALADAIVRKRIMAEVGLKERMKAEMSGWECGIQTAFGTKTFVQDVTAPIGSFSFNDVMDYIDDRLLQDLCIDKNNLMTFLENEVKPAGTEIYELDLQTLAPGVNFYVSNVLEHYFPDDGDTGLNDEIWDDADYDCHKLSTGDLYVFSR